MILFQRGEPMKIINATRVDPKFHAQVVLKDGSVWTEIYRDIRGSFVWPTMLSPGYALIAGQADQATSSGRFPVRFFTEAQADTLTDFFQQLSDLVAKYSCNTLYADRSEETRPYLEALDKFSRRQQIKTPSIIQGPFADDFGFAVGLIREWKRDGALSIPEDANVYGQIRQMAPEDLKDSPEIRFFAVRALGFLISSFERFDVGNRMTPEDVRALENAMLRPPGF
jgi:hypothetical protein